MIITIPITDVATLTIGVTDQMQQDLKECEKMAESMGDGKDCETCSWNKQEIENTGFCEMPAVVDKVLRTPDPDKCNGCFGAANGDCEVCNR